MTIWILTIIALLILIAWELHRIYVRLAKWFPTEEEKEGRYSSWWAELPIDQKAWYQQHPEEWAEAEMEIKSELYKAVHLNFVHGRTK